MQSICIECESKMSRFVKKKKKEAKGLLSNLGIKTPLSKVKCFVMYKNEWHCEQIFTGRW